MTRSASFTLAAGAVALDLMPRIERPVLMNHNGGPGERVSHERTAVPIFDTTWLHAQRAVDIALSNSEGEPHP